MKILVDIREATPGQVEINVTMAELPKSQLELNHGKAVRELLLKGIPQIGKDTKPLACIVSDGKGKLSTN